MEASKSYRILEYISKNEEERMPTLLFDAPVLLEENEDMKGISDHRDYCKERMEELNGYVYRILL